MTAPIRLDRLLGNLGYGSRRDIMVLCRSGRVLLDGARVASADLKVALEPGLAARLTVDGAALDPLPGLVLAMNKPLGVTCSHGDAGPLVYDLLPERWRRRDPPLSSAGRLDKDTSGLLLFTDDGALLHRIISPRSETTKRYRATLAEPLRPDAAAVLATGTLVLRGEDRPLLPAHLVLETPTLAVVTVAEGRYHQVRRMFAALGNRVVDLHRDRIGALDLPGDLGAGQWRPLSGAEVAAALAPAVPL
ncbi:pseudouridine synthase [Lichenibacterium minor]|nr:16S rRNA pseudouridine(516) synthase [Lichenibacterium minor]